MGFKNWFAGTVAGPQVYGNTMGPAAREAGSALANLVFMSHGTSQLPGPTDIFDSEEEMKAATFQPRYFEITRIDIGALTHEEHSVFKNMQLAMVSFAFLMNSNGALQFMRRENTSKFRNGFGPSVIKSMVDCGLADNVESARTALLGYIDSFEKAGIQRVLNMDRPASGDVLEHFILRAVDTSSPTRRYAFHRTGETGFDIIAIPMAQETIKSIAGAAQQYKW